MLGIWIQYADLHEINAADPYIFSSDFEYGEGLTKREHFAGLAMQGLLAHYGSSADQSPEILAIYYADELLKELENSND